METTFKYLVVRVKDRDCNIGCYPHYEPLAVYDDMQSAYAYAKSNSKICNEHGITCGIEIYKYSIDNIKGKLLDEEFTDELVNKICNSNKELKIYGNLLLECDYEERIFIEDEYESIDPEAIIVYYEHQTYMNYAFNILDIKRAKDAGVYSVQDLPPHVDHCYRPYALVTTNEELLNAWNNNTKDYIFTRINRGWNIIKQWLIDEGLLVEESVDSDNNDTE